MSLRAGLLLWLMSLSLLVSRPGFAQGGAGATVRGTVTDPDDALIPGATATLTPAAGRALTVMSGSDGTYLFNAVPPGTYSLTVTMKGFASYVKQGLRIGAGQAVTLDTKMAISTTNQEIQVTAQGTQLSVDQDNNASSTVIKGKDLDALSDDPDELSSELTALAGPAAGPNGGQIYVDGFTGGQLPPKSSIREIRVNQNPFSAQYDRLGFGRVEVFTKPGTDKFHGSYQINGNDSSFNTGNPVLNQYLSPGQVAIAQPPYHTIFMFGSITGPITSKSSFTMSGSHRNIQDNAIFNGTVLTPASDSTGNGSATLCPPGSASATCVIQQLQNATTFPQTRTELSPRLDFALSNTNTLTARFQYTQNSSTNNGLGSFNLPSTAYNTDSNEAEIQISDSQIVSSRIINETRFEFQRNRSTQSAQSYAPTINVQSSFISGGSSGGANSDHQEHIEVQNYTSVQLAKNFIRFGGRLRTTREATNTNAGTNGIFSYASLDAYQNNNVQNFSFTRVNVPTVRARLTDLGIYAESDWKPRPNLTFSYGFRYETQNQISDHHDFAPRVSFAYGLGSAKGSPRTVVRGGFGIFYDRFNLGNVLTTFRENGVNQTQYTLSNVGNSAPGCAPSDVAACLAAVSAVGNTTYTIAPHLRSPYTMQTAFGIDQQLFRGATVSVNYLNARGVHQFLSQNTAAIGRPYSALNTGLPVTDQYQSEGVFRQNQLNTNFNIRTRRITLFGYYGLNFAHADTSGPNYFPSIPGNIGADYGRAAFDVRSRLFLGGNVTLPHFISLSPFVLAQSGQPYNITSGEDTNGDSIVNDRPTFLAGQTSARCTDANTFSIPAFGTSYAPIPINYCTGPALFTMNLRATKTFGFGRRNSEGADRGSGQGGPAQGGPGGPGGPGGRGGGGGGRGGPGVGMGGGGTSTGKRYNLTLGAQLQNVFNKENLTVPVGTLTSRNFGQSLQLSGPPYTSSAAVQRLQLQASFSF